jgi:hypothetical protein
MVLPIAQCCSKSGELGHHDIIEIGTRRCVTAAGRGYGAAWLVHAKVHIQAFDPVLVDRVLRLALDAIDVEISVHCHGSSVV